MANLFKSYLFALAVGDLVSKEIGPRSSVWAEQVIFFSGVQTRVEPFTVYKGGWEEQKRRREEDEEGRKGKEGRR
jgi:hypothetical protein